MFYKFTCIDFSLRRLLHVIDIYFSCAKAMFSTVEGELKQLHHNQETLKKQFVELTELKYVLKQVEDLLREVR